MLESASLLHPLPFSPITNSTIGPAQKQKKVGFSGKGIRAGFSEDDIEEQNIREAETPRVLGSACLCIQFLGLKCNLLLFEETLLKLPLQFND